MTIRWFSCMLICVLLVGCHDAPRKNPFDPALTPAVELLDVQVDEKAGTAMLTWARYDGEMGFEAYRIQRTVVGMAEPDTTFTVSSVSDTAFVDESISPDTEYEYRVFVRSRGGYEVGSNTYQGAEYTLPSVTLEAVKSDSRTATASLSWSRYDGPRFKAYEVWRRTEEIAEAKRVHQTEDILDTSFDDQDLDGNTEYSYTVKVEDTTGVFSESEERVGGFHLFMEEYLLEIEGRTIAPHGLVIDADDNAYVAHRGSGVSLFVAQYDISFQYRGRALVTQSGGAPLKEGKVDLAPDGKGNVYGAFDLGGGGVRVFKVDDGSLLGRAITTEATEERSLLGVSVTEEGELLVASQSADTLSGGSISILARVFRFDEDGQELESFDVFADRAYNAEFLGMEVWDDTIGLILAQGYIQQNQLQEDGASGHTTLLGKGIGYGNGQLFFPSDMVKGDADRLFVLNAGAGRIEVFKGGKYLTKFGRPGKERGEFYFLDQIDVFRGGVALDSAGNVYVADWGNRRIQKFGP